MRKLFLIFFIIAIGCNSQPSIKKELGEAFSRIGTNQYIDIKNSTILNNKAHYIFTRYSLKDLGVELEITPIGNGLTSTSNTEKIFITYSSIKSVYIKNSDNEFHTGAKQIDIVLK